MSKAKENDKVKVHYTGRLTTGEEFDSSSGSLPLEFTVGSGQVILGFDQAVRGMEINEKKTFTIPAKDAYGSVNHQLIQRIDKSFLPENIDAQVGKELVASDQDGRQMKVTVIQVEDDHIVIDGNHPLAGKDLVFDIKLVEIV